MLSKKTDYAPNFCAVKATIPITIA